MKTYQSPTITHHQEVVFENRLGSGSSGGSGGSGGNEGAGGPPPWAGNPDNDHNKKDK